MNIVQVVGTLYCTQRIAGLEHCALRVLKDDKGKLTVATDPVGARSGNWVFVVSGSAGRLAMGDKSIMTDLAIGGIIDDWDDDEASAARPATQPTAEPNEAPEGSGAASRTGTTGAHQWPAANDAEQEAQAASRASGR